MRTLERVSGSRSPTRPPATSTPDARRMGMTLVMPTNEPKIRFPNTAASLHMALQNPNPVPLQHTNKHANTHKHTYTNYYLLFAFCILNIRVYLLNFIYNTIHSFISDMQKKHFILKSKIFTAIGLHCFISLLKKK